MTGFVRLGLRRRLGEMFTSLEKRIIGALALIVLCMGALLFVSQDRAARLLAESGQLRQAAASAEHAEQLARAVSQFRTATRSVLGGEGGTGNTGELTDIAMVIGEQVNALRLGGTVGEGDVSDFGSFDDLDRHVVRIGASARLRDPALLGAIETRNRVMTDVSLALRAQATARRDRAHDKLSIAAHDWQQIILAVGGVTGCLVLAIVADLLANIVPALRRMHAALRRLADGDLDFEVESFPLKELQALSGSLETFRRNALAVRNLAYTDLSTGMPNRRGFIEAVARFAGQCCPRTACEIIVMIADIDRFKHVNDDYGHASGDRLVAQIGERMMSSLHSGAFVARVGGDEFAIFVPLGEQDRAQALASRLVAEMRAPFELDGFQVAVTVSLGFVTGASNDRTQDSGTLLHRADMALYAAKSAGRNCARGFTRELEEQRELERALEHDLGSALAEGQVRVVYQPIHEAGDPAGGHREVEALVRWRHPEMGEIPPSRFIPAAERSGKMVWLGAWIIERALQDLRQWPDISLSINLSPLQLQQDGFVGFLLQSCRNNDIRPQRVILEVTESLSIERNTRALTSLELLRDYGFRIALDDFGTGYSSLCLMKTFRFDRLKLDRSLIDDIGRDATSQAVFDAAVTMALRIGAEVVAEGISAIELVEPVRKAGCTHLQGFHFSRPIEASEVAAYFRDGAERSARAA